MPTVKILVYDTQFSTIKVDKYIYHTGEPFRSGRVSFI